jgi:hypothetical protein
MSGPLRAGARAILDRSIRCVNAEITSIQRWDAVSRVHNLTVDDIHTYYVMAGNTPVLVHNCGGARFAVDSEGVATEIRPLGRGSTGRTVPESLNEKLAMDEAVSNPAAGRQLRLKMTDDRWHADDGWVKMAQNVNGTEIHYVRNTITGQVDDFRFK